VAAALLRYPHSNPLRFSGGLAPEVRTKMGGRLLGRAPINHLSPDKQFGRDGKPW
jgi:hypothetical protein